MSIRYTNFEPIPSTDEDSTTFRRTPPVPAHDASRSPDRDIDAAGAGPSEPESSSYSLSSKQRTNASNRTAQRNTLAECFWLWWKEIGAISVSICFLGAVIGVLLGVNNTALSKWSMPFGMQPTTLIALLITLSKVFLLVVLAEALSQLKWVYFQRRPQSLRDFEHFDSASRGVFGSALFVYHVRWRAVAACIGAALTVLAIAMEPFAQQALSFYSSTYPSEGLMATVPRASNYDTDTKWIHSPYFGGITPHRRKDYVPMLSAMIQGLYDPGLQSHYQCSSANCNWPTFETLGVCTTCNDITRPIKKDCNAGNITGGGDSHCTFSTPGGAALHTNCTRDNSGSFATFWNTASVGDVFGSYPLPNICEVEAISLSMGDYYDYSGCALNSNWRVSRPTATRCTFKWCVREYNTRLEHNLLTEEWTSTNDLVFPRDTCTDDPVFTNWTSSNRRGHYNYAAFKPNDVPTNICADWRSPSDGAFWINVEDTNDISTLLQMFFQSSQDTNIPISANQLLYATNHRDLSEDAHAIAEGLTHLIRQGPNMTQVDGTVHLTDLFVRVHWPWLAYPIGLVIISTGFLLAAILFSAEKSGVVWKSSSLASMFHGPSGLTEQAELRDTSEMEDAAEAMRVTLRQSDNGVLRLMRE